MFITVTSCEETAKKTTLESASTSLPSKFQDFRGQKLIFQDFPGHGNFTNTTARLSGRRANPVKHRPKW